MTRLFRFSSIRNQLIFWFIVATVLPLAGLVVAVYVQRAEANRQQAWLKLETIRDLKTRQIENWLNERRGDLRALASTPELRAIAEAPSGHSTQTPPRDAARQLLLSFRTAHPVYAEFFVADAATGRILISTLPQQEGRLCGNDPFIQTALRAQDLSLGKPYRAADGAQV